MVKKVDDEAKALGLVDVLKALKDLDTLINKIDNDSSEKGYAKKVQVEIGKIINNMKILGIEA